MVAAVGITFLNVKDFMTIRTQNEGDYEIPDDVTGADCMLASLSALDDWDTPEEDEAWEYLDSLT